MTHLEITVRDIDGRLLRTLTAQQALRVGSVVQRGRVVGTVIRVEELLQDGSWTQTVIITAASEHSDYVVPVESAPAQTRHRSSVTA